MRVYVIVKLLAFGYGRSKERERVEEMRGIGVTNGQIL